MHNRQLKVFDATVAAILLATSVSFAFAEEKIIQQEMISFKKCLNVITTSENKLSIAPEVTDVSTEKRVAVFTLTDGTLTITCDGVEGSVTVSTNMN